MAYEEPKDPLTGKSKRHTAAASAVLGLSKAIIEEEPEPIVQPKIDGTSVIASDLLQATKIVEVPISNEFLNVNDGGYLYAKAAYNPYFISVGGKEYEIKNITLYKVVSEEIDGKKVIKPVTISIGRGWFGSNNTVPNLKIPKTVRRLKPKYDGQTFITPRQKEYYQRSDRTPYAELHIPYEFFDFTISERVMDWGEGKRQKLITYSSKKDPKIWFDIHGESFLDPQAKPKADKLKAEMEQLEAELKAKKEALSRL